MTDDEELAAIQARDAGTMLGGGYEAEADRRTLLRMLNEARKENRRLIAESDAASAARMRIGNIIAERDEARAENERRQFEPEVVNGPSIICGYCGSDFSTECTQCPYCLGGTHNTEIIALRAENERLRKALTKIADACDDPRHVAYEEACIARAALGPLAQPAESAKGCES